MQASGAYTAERASALSGVPKSTIHYWATHDILVPTVSRERVRLWSYADLMGLRVIYWLRQRKTDAAGAEVPASSMKAVRRALGKLSEHGASLWTPDGATVFVDESGDVVLKGPAGLERADTGQLVAAGWINLIAPFSTREGLQGPDLVAPRPQVRIVPGKLSGAPHVAGTRLETHALYALEREGYSIEMIRSFYPDIAAEQIADALDLEHQLADNLAIRSAA